ncbi:hypothetical protein FRZ44_15460 [Hypericibacter terrae]|uniref:Uncharacterized protein n=1 Tax=Hypericibacter terrae TaxID=2602015 RepID=A0A5J6MFN9_9PROT|nr:hypothetical protein [Hypericibacter terrae]QEX16253.1 hypothetical protein FRZ44_15460 [Hypericibacter terrae]
MSSREAIDPLPEALDQLEAFLRSKSRSTRIAASKLWGRFVRLTSYELRELDHYRVDQRGLYAVTRTVTRGTELVIFFSVEQTSARLRLRMLTVVQVIGQPQMAAAKTKAMSYL